MSKRNCKLQTYIYMYLIDHFIVATCKTVGTNSRLTEVSTSDSNENVDNLR